jgi:hypothetical protein
MAIQCTTHKGVAKTCKTKAPITAIKQLFLTVPGFAFADETSFLSEADWLGYIADGSIIPLVDVREQEDQSFEDPTIETTNGEKVDTFEGQRGALYRMLYDLDQHQIMRLLSGQNFGLIKGDRNNNARATKLSGGTITGVQLSFFKVWKMTEPDAENAPYSMVQLQEDDPGEWDDNGIYATPTWRLSRLGQPGNGVLQVDLTCGAIAAGVFTATVKYINTANPTNTGGTNERAISGLDVNSFRIFDQAGALLTPTTDYTVVESTSTPGEYTIDTTAGTPITGGTCQVIAYSSGTTYALYNSEEQILT